MENNTTITIEGIIERAMRKAGVKKYELAEAMGITSPTLQRLLTDCLNMDGYQRKILADMLKIQQVQIDSLFALDSKKIDSTTVDDFLFIVPEKKRQPKKITQPTNEKHN